MTEEVMAILAVINQREDSMKRSKRNRQTGKVNFFKSCILAQGKRCTASDGRLYKVSAQGCLVRDFAAERELSA